MILIQNGRVMDPKSKKDTLTDILIDNDKIVGIGKVEDTREFDQVIDASGMIVAPGLIDIHVHFRDPGLTYKEDLSSGSAAAAAGGFTTVVCMANTKPIVDNKDTMKYVIDKASALPIHVHQASAVTMGFLGKQLVDMDGMKEAGAVGFTDDGLPIMNTAILMKAMEKAKELDMPISLHEEDPALIKRSGVNEGSVSKELNLGGAPRVAEDTMVARDCMLALETGACVDIQHISSAIAVDIVRYIKQLGANVVAEASPHHFTLTETAVLEHGAMCKMNPPIRTDEDRLAIIEGLKDGSIEIIATDHAPHSDEEKNKGLAAAPSGIIGLETSLALGITNLVSPGHLSMMQLLEKMTINPANLYRLNTGFLEVGGPAEVVIFDPNEEWVVDGFVSKASNSPFLGQKLTGKVKYTICYGKIAYQDK